eukprot:SAG11_NODE_26_length_23420_cov_40.459886_15_plen_37_part_00
MLGVEHEGRAMQQIDCSHTTCSHTTTDSCPLGGPHT